jgi:ABC-type bacteriocin/lantibiotic exporter with double-glycine peptidase domain
LTSKKGLITSLEESKFKYSLVSWLEELARSKDSFKLAGDTNLPLLRTDERVASYLNARENHYQILRIQYSMLLIFKMIVVFGLLIFGGILVINQQMNIGQFVAAEIIILLVVESSEKLILNLENVFDILTSLEKLGQVTDLELDEKSSTSSINHNIESPINVTVNELSFIYPSRTKKVLNNISFDFKSNGIYCISGKNGSGKSTFIHLLSGLYSTNLGNVCINGFPIGNYNLSELYRVVGNGLSEESIFEGTLLENITLGRDFILIEDVVWALEKVFLSDFVKSLPKGLDSPIDISGQKLTKSLVQRIIIARSIVNRPELLLLEYHIDFIEEIERNKIIDFITDKSNGWTLISVSNDNYLQQKVDEIIYLCDGEISKK